MCLEGTTPQDLHIKHHHRRTAFQAESSQQPPPGTAYPVTIASLCTAFQADCPQRNIFAHELHEWTRIVAMD